MTDRDDEGAAMIAWGAFFALLAMLGILAMMAMALVLVVAFFWSLGDLIVNGPSPWSIIPAVIVFGVGFAVLRVRAEAKVKR